MSSSQYPPSGVPYGRSEIVERWRIPSSPSQSPSPRRRDRDHRNSSEESHYHCSSSSSDYYHCNRSLSSSRSRSDHSRRRGRSRRRRRSYRHRRPSSFSCSRSRSRSSLSNRSRSLSSCSSSSRSSRSRRGRSRRSRKSRRRERSRRSRKSRRRDRNRRRRRHRRDSCSHERNTSRSELFQLRWVAPRPRRSRDCVDNGRDENGVIPSLPQLETEETLSHPEPCVPMNTVVCVDELLTSSKATTTVSFDELPMSAEPTIDEFIQMAHLFHYDITSSDIVTFWNEFAPGNNRLIARTERTHKNSQLRLDCREIIQVTKLKSSFFSMEELSQTIFSIALIVSSSLTRYRAACEGEWEAALRNLLLNQNTKEEIFNHFARMSVDKLHQSDAHILSNLAFAYASIGFKPSLEDGQDFLELVAMKALEIKSDFNAQDISMMLHAYVSTSNTKLPKGPPAMEPRFHRFLADHVVALVDEFQPQVLCTTVWAFAKLGIDHTELFKSVTDHISGIVIDTLVRFTPKDLSRITRACAISQYHHPELFKRVAQAAIHLKDEFNAQHATDLLWAYATMGIEEQIFVSFAPIVAALLDTATIRHISTIAWSYSIANVDVPDLFNVHFVNQVTIKCAKKNVGVESLSRLHQWNLWQTKEKMRPGLQSSLQDSCYKAFTSQETHPSKFQNKIVLYLLSIGVEPKEEVVMDSGYSIDALVTVDGRTIGIEVDGPCHFIGESRCPLGATILKRRQVQSIDGIELISLTHWDWIKSACSTDKKQKRAQKQEFLRDLLGLGRQEDS